MKYKDQMKEKRGIYDLGGKEKSITLIIILLVVSASIPAIALSNQTEVNASNVTENSSLNSTITDNASELILIPTPFSQTTNNNTNITNTSATDLNSTATAIPDEFKETGTSNSQVNFVPENISAIMPGETINVSIVLNSTEGVCWFRADLLFNPTVVNITNASAGDFPRSFTMVHHENYVSLLGFDPDYNDKPPGKWYSQTSR